MSSGRRRPGDTGVHGAAALLLLGVLSLGVGVLVHLQDDDRALVAQDLGDVPGPRSAAAPRPLSEVIPVLSGLGDRPPGPAVVGRDEMPPVPVSRNAGNPGAEPLDGPPSGAGAPPAGAPPGVGPAGTLTPEPTTEPTTEPTPVLVDPTLGPFPPRPPPRPLPSPGGPLAPQEPGLVSAIYPLPEPTPAATPRAPLVPTRLELPARAVTAPVDSVATSPNGGMVVPDEVRTVGWWAPGVLPGGIAGSAVIAGHVDSRTGGLGVLSVLPQLTEGEPVLVGDGTGRTVAFRVAARREYGKYDLPRDVFRRDGSPQLVLITCGGVFDPVARSYESNVVVYAVPA